MPKKRYDHPTFRLAEWGEQEKIIDFVNEHFDYRLPLVNDEALFNHYYLGDRVQFALAEEDGELLAVAGYILANHAETPDLWVSVWVAIKGANGVGLSLMDALPRLTGARLIACNNIRENTCVFYRFLGWTAERLSHYYRLSARASEGYYQLYRPNADLPAVLQGSAESTLIPSPRYAVGGDLTLDKVSTAIRLKALGLPVTTAPAQTPAKDIGYLLQRYFSYPYLSYDVWSVHEGQTLRAYCITRTVRCEEPFPDGTPVPPVLRVVDLIGDADILPRIGASLDALMEQEGAEYTDCYCAGIPAETFAKAGFCERKADDDVIVPNYLTPPLIANTDYFYFTNNPTNFTMFKADGDQDRPNLP